MLDRILDATRERVADLRTRRAAVMEKAEAAASPPSFEEALSLPGLAVIAEIKRRSPSKGDLAIDLDAVEQARRYAAGGAAALSVLTEPVFFAGHPEDLVGARETTGLPILRKDFVIESLQIWEARAMGASAVLLIAAALTPNELAALLDDAGRAGLGALVEVHTIDEAKLSVDLGARIVGVNNRDLASFEVDLATAEDIAPFLSDAAVTVAESGIHSGVEASRMRAAGYDAVLVGEALVRSADPSSLIREIAG
ncbi:MAG TPA: indole-3-glycerol phosphate synthase TrpC [Acidimicrobiia bacterium]|nr:indole-3-glycerol phosphate synthase TrpC [Acidimicrobiia bacterium]